ncbi:MAG: helix-turn-helix domain-containing protein [Planctomycetota bacterium]
MYIPPRPKPFAWKKARRMYEEEGLSFAEIARRLGRSAQLVRRVLRLHGVAKRKPQYYRRGELGRMLAGKWRSILARCSNPHDRLYSRYGALGFRVCREWKRSFGAFYDWAVGTGYRPGMVIELLPGRRLFSPHNCRWITVRQRLERDGISWGAPRRFITAFGERKGLLAWSRDPRCTVSTTALRLRLERGFPPERAITLPAGEVPRRKWRRKRARPRRLVDWKLAERMYTEEGLSCAAIASRLGMAYGTIRQGMVARGYSPRDDHSRYRLKHWRELYKAWSRIRQETTNPRDRRYPVVGGRGIRVGDEWSRFEPFHAWALKAGYRPGLCLARIRADRNFTPGNCEWTTRADLSLRATPPRVKPKARWTITAFGETKGPTEWGRDPRCQVSSDSLIIRLRSGMDPEAALTRPPRTPGKRRKPIRWLTAFGLTKPLVDWAKSRYCKVTLASLVERLQRGVPPEDALSKPPRRCPVPRRASSPRKRRRG